MNFNDDKVISKNASDLNDYNIKNQTQRTLKFSVTVLFRSDKMQEILRAFELEDFETLNKEGIIMISSRVGTLNLGRAEVITDREQGRRSQGYERFDNS